MRQRRARFTEVVIKANSLKGLLFRFRQQRIRPSCFALAYSGLAECYIFLYTHALGSI
jgi:hypothetical protein